MLPVDSFHHSVYFQVKRFVSEQEQTPDRAFGTRSSVPNSEYSEEEKQSTCVDDCLADFEVVQSTADMSWTRSGFTEQGMLWSWELLDAFNAWVLRLEVEQGSPSPPPPPAQNVTWYQVLVSDGYDTRVIRVNNEMSCSQLYGAVVPMFEGMTSLRYCMKTILNDGRLTIADYGLHEQSMVNVCYRLQGGARLDESDDDSDSVSESDNVVNLCPNCGEQIINKQCLLCELRKEVEQSKHKTIASEALTRTVMQLLQQKPSKAVSMLEHMGQGISKKDVNRVLYKLLTKGLVTTDGSEPPTWSLAGPHGVHAAVPAQPAVKQPVVLALPDNYGTGDSKTARRNRNRRLRQAQPVLLQLGSEHAIVDGSVAQQIRALLAVNNVVLQAGGSGRVPAASKMQ